MVGVLLVYHFKYAVCTAHPKLQSHLYHVSISGNHRFGFLESKSLFSETHSS